MKNQTLAYPVDRNILPVLRYKFYDEDIEIVACVAPSGWGITGKDVGTIDYGKELGILVTQNFESAIYNCDSLLLAESDKSIDYEIIQKNVEKSVSMGKNIYCFKKITAQQHAHFKAICKEKGVEFRYYCNNLDKQIEIDETKVIESRIVPTREINVPIVSVFGLLEGVSKFETQLAFLNYLKHNGYKTALITSRSYGAMGGQFSIPDYMYSKSYTELEKIILFNHYVKMVEDTQKPDLIVIGIPGGIIPINKKAVNRFGITAYELSRSVKFDASILCTYFEEYTEEYFKNLNLLCKYRFGAEIVGSIIDTIVLELHAQATPEDVSIMSISEETLKNKFATIKNSFSSLVETKMNMTKVFDHVLDTLVNNAETKIL